MVDGRIVTGRAQTKGARTGGGFGMDDPFYDPFRDDYNPFRDPRNQFYGQSYSQRMADYEARANPWYQDLGPGPAINATFPEDIIDGSMGRTYNAGWQGRVAQGVDQAAENLWGPRNRFGTAMNAGFGLMQLDRLALEMIAEALSLAGVTEPATVNEIARRVIRGE